MVDEERTLGDWSNMILPRVLRAAIWGLLVALLLLVPYDRIIAGRDIPDYLPVDQTAISFFFYALIGFEVAIQLFRETILQHALSVARGFLTIFFLVFITQGGVLGFSTSSTPELPMPEGLAVSFAIDFRAILACFLVLSLLGVLKNIVQAIDFMSTRAEEPVFPPELP